VNKSRKKVSSGGSYYPKISVGMFVCNMLITVKGVNKAYANIVEQAKRMLPNKSLKSDGLINQTIAQMIV
jgi:hypothetical protein